LHESGDNLNKSKYDEKVKPKLFNIEAWARDGMQQKEMAKKLGVPYSSFCEYIKVHPQLKAALKIGREEKDICLENAAFRSAIGYKTKQIKKEAMLNPKTMEYEMKVSEEITKEMPANPAMLKFLMTNRMPEKYKDKQEIEHGGTIGIKKLEDLL
jgi:hypothetical protein